MNEHLETTLRISESVKTLAKHVNDSFDVHLKALKLIESHAQHIVLLEGRIRALEAKRRWWQL